MMQVLAGKAGAGCGVWGWCHWENQSVVCLQGLGNYMEELGQEWGKRLKSFFSGPQLIIARGNLWIVS